MKTVHLKDESYFGRITYFVHCFTCPLCQNLIDTGNFYCASCGSKVYWDLKKTLRGEGVNR